MRFFWWNGPTVHIFWPINFSRRDFLKSLHLRVLSSEPNQPAYKVCITDFDLKQSQTKHKTIIDGYI